MLPGPRSHTSGATRSRGATGATRYFQVLPGHTILQGGYFQGGRGGHAAPSGGAQAPCPQVPCPASPLPDILTTLRCRANQPSQPSSSQPRPQCPQAQHQPSISPVIQHQPSISPVIQHQPSQPSSADHPAATAMQAPAGGAPQLANCPNQLPQPTAPTGASAMFPSCSLGRRGSQPLHSRASLSHHPSVSRAGGSRQGWEGGTLRGGTGEELELPVFGITSVRGCQTWEMKVSA